MSKQKILIIEDEADIAQVLAKRLMTAGYETMISSDAILGITEAHKYKPDLVVLDLMLPGGGGQGALNRLKLLRS